MESIAPSPGPNEPPVQATLAPLATQTAPARRRSVWPRIFLLFLLLAFFGSLAINLLLMLALGISRLGGFESDGRVQEQYFSGNRYASEKVAILSIEGIISSGDGFFRRELDHAHQEAKDGTLKALVLRVNSPGGTIFGSDDIYHGLQEFRQKHPHVPVVVSMGGIAASGGYYVSMAVGDAPETIYAEPTTFTGSIGVIIPHFNLAGTMEKLGVQEESIVSHPLKDMGSYFRPLTEKERTIFQGLVDEGFHRFKEVVQAGRPRFKHDPQALDAIATGQIFNAPQALENGLVDKIGYLEDAVDRAITLAGVQKDEVKVVRYHPELRLADLLLGIQAKKPPALDFAQFLESTTPRAYYLCTWLPGLGVNP